MKAIRVSAFGEPDVLKLEDAPDPVVGVGQILVRVRAAGVNPFETYIRTGKYASLPTLPYTPGVDCAGIVEDIGEGASDLAKGERVYTAGSITGVYAELALAQRSQVHRLPDNVSFEQGAALGVPYGTAYRAIHHVGHGEPGQTVLIHGASGGVGIAAVELAHAAGLIVIGTAGSDRGKALVKEHGADYVMGHEESNDPTRLQEVTGKSTVNLIVEMLANVNLARDLPLLGPGGRVVVVGSRGPIEIDPRLLFIGEKIIQGLTLFAATPEQLAEAHADIVKGLEIGALKPVVERKFPLAEAAEAHRAIMSGSAFGKIVLIP